MLHYASIALMAFLTLVDLFATQAILPTLAAAYQVSPAAMGFAVNASTIGMAIAALAVALFGRRIDRRLGIFFSLAVLSIPTAALAVAPNLQIFTALRVLQGLAMASAFALTLSYLSEHCSANVVVGAFAAYVTGNVASNLFGRLMSAALADHLGLAGNFYTFAALNIAGAVLAWFSLDRALPISSPMAQTASWRTLIAQLRNPALRVSFAIGFLILFAFVGVFTYVNFVLARPPIALSAMDLGLVYFVFGPALVTTPLAGRVVARLGVRNAFRWSLAVAGLGLPLLLLPNLSAVIFGLACIGMGTFFAQAATTGFVGRAATSDPSAASGMYLASYFFGGLVSAALIGQLFQRFGWSSAIAAIGLALGLAAVLAQGMVPISDSVVAKPRMANA